MPKRVCPIKEINDLIQLRLRLKKLTQCTSIDASEWLEAEGLLRADRNRPGRPLRVLLRKGLIKGAKKCRDGRWVISRIRHQV